MCAAQSIRELCIALFHRWEPERILVIITAYFDESGTHRSSPVSMMAGHVGDARQWQKFEKRISKLFRRYHVDVFHAIEIKRSDKDFRGWSVNKKIDFVDEFSHIVNETTEIGFSAVIRDDDYRKFYLERTRPKKVIADTKYGVLFRASLSSAIRGVLSVPRWADGKKPSLHVVLESGHPNAGDALRIYEFYRTQFHDEHKGILSGIAFKSKEEQCLPLAASDWFAYCSYQLELGSKMIGTAQKPLKTDASYRGNMYRLEINSESLEQLYVNSISEYWEKQKRSTA